MSAELISLPSPVRAPAALARWVCAQHGADPAKLVEMSPQRQGRAVRRWRSGSTVIDVAMDGEGARRIRLEVRGRRWAEAEGIPTPAVLGADPRGGWSVASWVPNPVDSGPVYVSHCLDAARRIASRTALPPGHTEATSWRAPRRTVLVRGVRTVAGGVSPRLWRNARRQVDDIAHPLDVAHGDFYPRNVLGTVGGGVMVVDWEYVGMAPRHTDLARLWSVLAAPDDRDRVLAEMLRDADRDERHRVGALLLWHALRLCGENLSAPVRDRNRQTLRHARSSFADARDLARELEAWPS